MFPRENRRGHKCVAQFELDDRIESSRQDTSTSRRGYDSSICALQMDGYDADMLRHAFSMGAIGRTRIKVCCHLYILMSSHRCIIQTAGSRRLPATILFEHSYPQPQPNVFLVGNLQ
ncbi:hypothetical protein ANO14919_091110 [Xylariales sp. No.14919]|nr:hypothetical protein ANO14919_091110 [Xylariales sp. No.14919]